MKKIFCFVLIGCFLVVAIPKPVRAGDPFSIGAALLGGFLIGTIWAPRVEVRGPAVQYQYPQPQYRGGGYYPAPQYYSPPVHYQAPAYYSPPPPAPIAPTTVCAQDISGNVNCRTIQY